MKFLSQEFVKLDDVNHPGNKMPEWYFRLSSIEVDRVEEDGEIIWTADINNCIRKEYIFLNFRRYLIFIFLCYTEPILDKINSSFSESEDQESEVMYLYHN